MKISSQQFTRGSEHGLATVVCIALLAIMMILITAESRSLYRLHREVKFIEQQQTTRLNGSPTNSVPTKILKAR